MAERSGVEVLRWARGKQRDFLMRDFFAFAKHSGICPDITEEEYRDVCDYLESRIPRRRTKVKITAAAWKRMYALFLMPRLTFKTSLISALCIYAMLLDYIEIGRIDICIVLGRSTTKLAEATLYGIKTEIERNPVLQSAFGNLRALFDKWTDEQITCSVRDGGIREPTIDTTGLNTSKTGAHPDLVILDDLVNEQNYESAAEMQRARLLVTAYYPIIERWGSLLVVGTRWGDNDVYGWAIDQDERRREAGSKVRWDYYITGAYTDEAGQQVRFPSVLPETRIQELRDTIEPKLFAAWILNKARAEGENIFTIAQIRYADIVYTGGPFAEIELLDTDRNAPLLRRFGKRVPLAVIMLVDPAPTVGPRSDFTGVNVVGFDPDRNWWALYAAEVKKLPTERLNLILFLARKYEPTLLALENADMDAPLLQERMREMGLQTRVVSFNPRQDRLRITADPKLAPRGRTSKDAQIEALEPVLRAGRIFFAAGETAPLVRQITKYPYIDHDDVIDSFSMAKAYEQRPDLRADPDPERVLREIEKREYALEGLDEDGNDLDTPRKRSGGAAGYSSARL